ncbi:MAG TPA: hypothetical protein VHO06_16025 [Polyangia bacterium]|nr:hypothetical protein [Polyangia bacterium]
MTRTSTRFHVAAALAGLLALAAAGTARAQSAGSVGGTTFDSSDFLVSVQAVPGVSLSNTALQRFFNEARCDCATPVTVFVGLLQTGVPKRAQVTSQTGTVQVWLGADCGTDAGLAGGGCSQLATESILTFLEQTSYSIATDAQRLSAVTPAPGALDAGTSAGGCSSASGPFTQTINVNFDFDGDNRIDLTVPFAINVDLTPPPSPGGVTVQDGSEALVLDWTPLAASSVTDLLGYQVLCSRADQYQVFKETLRDDGTTSGPFSAAFQACPATMTATGVEGEDPTFVCSPLLSASTKSYRVEVLQNDITYAAALVAIDDHGNPSGPPQVLFGKPSKTFSFYDTYRNDPTDPGGAAGGYCAVAAGPPRARSTATALALFGAAGLGLVLGRRRKRSRR